MDKNIEDMDKHLGWLNSEHYSAAGDIFGEPQKTTRIGDEYQAQIPSLMTENKCLQLIALPTYHDAKTDFQNGFEFGLPIPVSWVHSKHINKKETFQFAEGEFGYLGFGTDNDLFPVPCSTDEESWSEIEHDNFVLGLYIFGKNLCVVNKFLGNKGMQNVTSYYYGKFYRSAEHKKWSTYRKKKSRKCVVGKKIFKGWRRQELLSRLLPLVTDECKTHLTQVSSTFDRGKFSFEKYVFTLRDTVGINFLVEAVAIGKEDQDLTTKTKKRVRSKKRCTTGSSLTTQEIVDILKDQIGLNKARLNDIFCDAVWPRLLATGWHSEQTTNYALQNSKHSLVFLAPGVAKFSRRSLEKGSQYFDSLAEVLKKVALEPELLEQERNQGEFVEPQVKQGWEDKQDLMKCTIVDTSSYGLVNLTDVTSLSVFEPSDMQVPCSVSGESQNKDSEIHGVVNSFDCEMINRLDPVVSRIEDQKTNLSTNGQPVRKLNLILKPKAECHRVNDNKSEDEVMEYSCSEKKSRGVVIDLNSPQLALVLRGDNLKCATKESVSPESGGNGQIIRQSTRNRPLTTKALEALANGFLNPEKKRRGSGNSTQRHVRAKTALVSSFGAHYLENRVDGVS